MLPNTIAGILRVGLGMASGWALSKGFTAGTWEAVTGGIVAIAAAVWSVYSNRLPAMLQQIAGAPEVIEVKVDTPALANFIPSDKVVS